MIPQSLRSGLMIGLGTLAPKHTCARWGQKQTCARWGPKHTCARWELAPNKLAPDMVGNTCARWGGICYS